jgi:hypothetical protein
MSDLADFLLARLSEDQQMYGHVTDYYFGDAWAPFAWGTEIDVNGARWLAECDAKRRVLAEHGVEYASNGSRVEWLWCPTCQDGTPCATVRLLAFPYAEHPEYRDEWRP